MVDYSLVKGGVENERYVFAGDGDVGCARNAGEGVTGGEEVDTAGRAAGVTDGVESDDESGRMGCTQRQCGGPALRVADDQRGSARVAFWKNVEMVGDAGFEARFAEPRRERVEGGQRARLVCGEPVEEYGERFEH